MKWSFARQQFIEQDSQAVDIATSVDVQTVLHRLLGAHVSWRSDELFVRRSQGRFRAFLLAAMNHFLAKEWRKARTLKRGGGQAAISLDRTIAEDNLAEPTKDIPPEQAFDRRWAEVILERAAQRVQNEYVHAGREFLFRSLNVFLSVPADTGEYEAVANALGMTKSAVAKAVERMRKRFRDLVREQISQTVSSESELEDELRYLVSILTK